MLRWRPEWPYLALVLVAWVVVLLAGAGGHVGAPPASGEPRQPESAAASHEHHHAEPAAPATAVHGATHGSGSRPAALTGWMLMSVAMMMPVVLPAVRHVGLNSLRQRRQWAMLVFFAVYVGAWAAFGFLALGWQRLALRTIGIDARALLTGTLVVAAAYAGQTPGAAGLPPHRAPAPHRPAGRCRLRPLRPPPEPPLHGLVLGAHGRHGRRPTSRRGLDALPDRAHGGRGTDPVGAARRAPAAAIGRRPGGRCRDSRIHRIGRTAAPGSPDSY